MPSSLVQHFIFAHSGFAKQQIKKINDAKSWPCFDLLTNFISIGDVIRGAHLFRARSFRFLEDNCTISSKLTILSTLRFSERSVSSTAVSGP